MPTWLLDYLYSCVDLGACVRRHIAVAYHSTEMVLFYMSRKSLRISQMSRIINQ